MIPREATISIVEEELKPALSWSEFNGVELTWHPESLELRAVLSQRATGDSFHLRGNVNGYRVLPPAWEFCSGDWSSAGARVDFPAKAQVPGVQSSIFHPKGVICAPFNRLAYKAHGGPHDNWGGPEQWLTVRGANVRAVTLGDMLAVVARDLAYSEGRME